MRNGNVLAAVVFVFAFWGIVSLAVCGYKLIVWLLGGGAL